MNTVRYFESRCFNLSARHPTQTTAKYRRAEAALAARRLRRTTANRRAAAGRVLAHPLRAHAAAGTGSARVRRLANRANPSEGPSLSRKQPPRHRTRSSPSAHYNLARPRPCSTKRRNEPQLPRKQIAAAQDNALCQRATASLSAPAGAMMSMIVRVSFGPPAENSAAITHMAVAATSST